MQAVSRLKKIKYVSVDVILSEIIKFEDVKQAMLTFLVIFNKCFKVKQFWQGSFCLA